MKYKFPSLEYSVFENLYSFHLFIFFTNFRQIKFRSGILKYLNNKNIVFFVISFFEKYHEINKFSPLLDFVIERKKGVSFIYLSFWLIFIRTIKLNFAVKFDRVTIMFRETLMF